MKLKLFNLFVLTLLLAGQIQAQKTLLPFGQFEKHPWEATCFSAASSDSEPANWYAKDFDDSSWTKISGPISSENGLPYYNYEWDKELTNGVYYTRRHFTVDDLDKIDKIQELYFYITFPYSFSAYLNGTLIYNDAYYYGNKYPNYSYFKFGDNFKRYFTEGDNVIAVKISNRNGGDAFMDYGLYAYSITNGTFVDGQSGWSGDFGTHTKNSNTYAYSDNNYTNASCFRTIPNAITGVYKLSANACGLEYYYNKSEAIAHKNNTIPTVLYINDYELNIPSAFRDATSYNYGDSWLIDEKYVPQYTNALSRMFDEGLYECEVWDYYEADSSDGLEIGIRCKATDNINRWAAWDNMDIDYYNESEIDQMLSSVIATYSELNKKFLNKQLKSKINSWLTSVTNPQSLKDKSIAFVNLKNQEWRVRKSIEAYESIEQLLNNLQETIQNAASTTSPATLADAKKLYDTVKSAHDNGDYEDNEIPEVITKLNYMIKRFSYAYLDVTVGVPGSLGDSILFKVENFVDVQSLKISGNLNDADMNVIKNNLSHLKELDMEGTNVTAIPNNFFYQRSALELIKFPSGLKTIGERAFYQCSSLDNLEFPSTLTTIKTYAFYDCDNIKELVLNEGLKTLDTYAFYNCDNIKYVKFPSTLTTIGSNAFESNYKLEKIDFSEGLRYINYRAFYSCSKLNNLTFPNSLYYIGQESFSQNSSLNNITFNEGLTRIYDDAFYNCYALTEITLPSSLLYAYNSPFDYCSNLKKVTCLSIEPPLILNQVPYGVTMAGRELYVPELSINEYKQHDNWSKFPIIKPINSLPQDITVYSDLKLTIPDSLPSDYKPNINFVYNAYSGNSYDHTGNLTVNGNGNLSIASFNISWSHNNEVATPNYSKNYCSFVNNSNLSADIVSITVANINNRWTFLTFPFNVKVSDITFTYEGATNYIIRRYDGGKRAAGESSQTWVKVNDDDILNAGEGYIMQSSRYVGSDSQYYSGFNMRAIDDESKNNIFIKDDATVELKEYESEYSHSRSWNLIGNPYPCYYDTRFMDFTAPITVRNMSNSTYSAYSPVDDKYILCPGEAFFVQRPIDNGTIIFSKDGRQTDRTARTIETPAKAYSPNAAERVIANVSISDGVSTDRTRIVLNDDAMMDYEMDKDASKFMSEDMSVPQIYTSCNGVDFAINERPVADGTVDLDLYIGQDGSYTISLLEDIEDYRVMIEDNAEGSKTELNSGSDYTFMAKAGEIRGRFVLHFVNEATGINAIGDINDENAAIYSIDGVKVKSPAQKGIYIKNGKKIVVNK